MWLFSDLKRHDLGEENAARHPDHGVATRMYLTRRLWGLAASAPYMYDGGAPSLERAVEMHGGEASAARTAYQELDREARADLQVYLLSLDREKRLAVP